MNVADGLVINFSTKNLLFLNVGCSTCRALWCVVGSHFSGGGVH